METAGMTQVTAFSILAMTVSLSLLRPKLGRIQVQPAMAAAFGALLCLTLGIVTLPQALKTTVALVAPLSTIMSLMLITRMAESVGLLAVLARGLQIAARNDGRKLFTCLFFSGTALGTFFTNDAAVLVLTPIVFLLLDAAGLTHWDHKSRLPYYFAVLYIGNLVGALTVSNPINIIAASIFNIGFLEYARWMVLPAIVSMVVTWFGLRRYFRTDIPGELRSQRTVGGSQIRVRDCVVCTAVLGLTLVGFFTESLTRIPTAVVALSGAALLLGVFGGRSTSRVREVASLGWDIPLFVIWIHVVAEGLKNVGLTEQMASLILYAGGDSIIGRTFAIGLLSALSSSLINNHPTLGTMVHVIRELDLSTLDTQMMVFATLIGGDLGPKMLPIGSLAALIWFRMLRDRNVHVPYSLYIRIGIPITLAALFCSLAVLNLERILLMWWLQ